MARHHAFTLIELLVVVTIIVVLLALLIPALDKAIYQAELVQCATGLRAGATGVTAYAFDHKRAYPPKWAADAGDQPHALADNLHDKDDRPYIVSYVALDLLLDPFLPEVNLDINDDDLEPSDDVQRVFSHRTYWWSWKFDNQAAQKRVGSRFAWKAPGGTDAGRTFDVLISDYDEQRSDVSIYYSTHPDRDGLMSVEREETEQYAFVRWNGNGGRGPLDLNFAHQDNSVTRVSDLPIEGDSDPVTRVPQTAASSVTWDLWFTRLPGR